MKINGTYSLIKDRAQWILTEHYISLNKKSGEAKEKQRQSYHATLRQVAQYMIDNGEYESLDSYIESAREIADSIEITLTKGFDDDKASD